MTVHIRRTITLLLLVLTFPACQAPFARKMPSTFSRMDPPKNLESAKSGKQGAAQGKAVLENMHRQNELESRLNEVESQVARLKTFPKDLETSRRIEVMVPETPVVEMREKRSNNPVAELLPEPSNVKSPERAEVPVSSARPTPETPNPAPRVAVQAPPAPIIPVAVETPKVMPPPDRVEVPVVAPEEHMDAPQKSEFSVMARELKSRAKSIFQKIISDFPDTQEAANAALGLGALHEEDSAWDQAIESYKRIVNKAPDPASRAAAHLGIARALVGKGVFLEAHDMYQSFADNFPKDPAVGKALLSAADCLNRAGEKERALKEYRALERSSPGPYIASMVKRKIAELLSDMKQYPEAVRAYTEALNTATEEPERLEIRSGLVRSLIAANMKDEARAKLKEMLVETTPAPARAEARMQLAVLLEFEQKPLDAAWTYSQAVSDLPDSPNAPECRLRAAQSFLKSGLVEHAREHLQELSRSFGKMSVAERRRLEPEALFAMAKSFQSDVDINRARAPLTALRSQYPEHPLAVEADLEESDILFNAGMREKALAFLQDVVKSHPDTDRAAAARLRLVQLYELAPSRNQKLPLLQILEQKCAPGAEKANLELRHALLLQEAGRDDEAMAKLKALLDSKETPAREAALAQYSQASHYQRTGKLKEAATAFDGFLARTPEKDAANQAALEPLIQNAKWTASKIKWLNSLKGPGEVSLKR